ncbi:MAG TPA: metal-dependent hydrolase [Gaiellales bacterium]|jgi:L-ascorbate metabolism protein UlaG (beta-lactamase superfamily)|nr:metal-dependent hydrolase [Gaiellales bacterium]
MSGITWLGHGSFQIDTPAGARVLIDPWITGNPSWPEGVGVERCDAILLTHGHIDHAADAAEIAKQHGAPVATIPELAGWLEGQGAGGTVGFNKGGAIEIAGLHVTMTNAVHSSSAPDGTPLGDPAGFVIEGPDMPTIYAAGDTAVHADMGLIGEIYTPSIAILPIGDHYTMGPLQAAYAARLLAAPEIVPGHYGTFGLLTGTPEALRGELARIGVSATVHEVSPGEVVRAFA